MHKASASLFRGAQPAGVGTGNVQTPGPPSAAVWWVKSRAMIQISMTWTWQPLLASGKAEVYNDLCFYFHGLALQKIWPIFPVLHGLHCGGHQHGVP